MRPAAVGVIGDAESNRAISVGYCHLGNGHTSDRGWPMTLDPAMFSV
jgi:hypothetical protein